MSFIFPIFLDFSESSKEDEVQYLYDLCINKVFELQGFLKMSGVSKITKALKQIELRAEQEKARYLSSQIEKVFNN